MFSMGYDDDCQASCYFGDDSSFLLITLYFSIVCATLVPFFWVIGPYQANEGLVLFALPHPTFIRGNR